MYSVVTHIDTLMNYNNSDSYVFSEFNENFHVDLVKMKESNVKIAVFAVFVEPKYKPYFSLQRSLQIIDRFHTLLDSQKELKLIKEYSDIQQVMDSDKIGAILSVEGADGIFDRSALRLFFRLGVRMISLTWNQRNHLADGVGEIAANGGLTVLGRKMIKEMNRLNIIIDVSHISPAGFWDIVKCSRGPIIASHSNAMSICLHKRNLEDKQLKAISEKGGVIGINFAPFFISKSKEVEIIDLIKHIDYIKRLIGIDSIVLGTDYDGIDRTPTGLEHVGKLINLKNKLFEANFNRKEIEKIFYKNSLDFFKKIWR